MNTGPNAYWYIGLLLPALVLLAVFYYRRTVPEVTPPARRLLLALRLCTLLTLAVALAQPVFDWQNSRPGSPRWQVLVDYSTSMDRIDADGRSRLELALDLASDSAWDRTTSGVFVERSYFAGVVATDTAGLEREGTDLHAALSRLAESADLPRAVVVLSDGAVNGSRDPAATTWPFPVYSICLGDSTPTQDLAVTEMVGPATAVAGDSVKLVVQATSEGDPTSAVVEFEAGAKRQSRTEHFDGHGRKQEFTFVFRPDTAGLYRVRASVAAGRDEVTTSNNRVDAHVYVEPRKRRCLLLGLAPDWETAFLSRALSRNDRLDTDVRYRRLEAGERRPWPLTLDSLLVYDAIILTDMAAAEWSFLAPALGHFVREGGGGVLFLFGPQAATAVWQPEQEQLLGVKSALNPPGVMAVDAPLRITPLGAYHPVTATDDGATWGDASRLSGLIPTQEMPGTTRLLELGQSAISWPALVAFKPGSGRVLTGLGFPFWRLGFVPEAKAAQTSYQQFWQRALAWLSTSAQASRLTVDHLEGPLPLFTAPEFSAVLVDEAWQPDPRASVTAIVRDADSNLVQSFDLVSTGGGRYQGSGRPMSEGEYRFEVTARRDTLLVGSQSGPLRVSSVSREAMQPSARPASLDLLAAASGGRRLGLGTWRDELSALPRDETVQIQYGTLRLWDHPWLLSLVLVLLAAEWILRRRYQML